MFLAGAVLVAGFFVREHYAPEPIIPLSLFKVQTFTLSNFIAFVSGVAMFGALAFLPQYLQLVRGASAVESGLLLLPMLGGVLSTSIASGRYITRTGRYRWFPLVGTTLTLVAMAALSQLHAHTSFLVISISLVLFGAGLGLFGQVLTIMVQNAVPTVHMGVGTSSIQFFRSMGGAIGASTLGALLTARLAVEFTRHLPAGSTSGSGSTQVASLISSPQALNALKATDPALHEGIIVAYSNALDALFLASVPVALLSVVAAVFVKQVRLRGSVSEVKTTADTEPTLAAGMAH